MYKRYIYNDPGEIEIPLNGEYNETIELNKDNNMEYIFRVKNNKLIYFFKANETGIFHYGPENPCSDLCALQNGKLHINYYRNITEDKIIEIQIYSFPISDKDIEIESRFLNNGELRSFFSLHKKNTYFIIQTKIDYISYNKIFDGTCKTLVAEYNQDMN